MVNLSDISAGVILGGIGLALTYDAYYSWRYNHNPMTFDEIDDVEMKDAEIRELDSVLSVFFRFVKVKQNYVRGGFLVCIGWAMFIYTNHQSIIREGIMPMTAMLVLVTIVYGVVSYYRVYYEVESLSL